MVETSGDVVAALTEGWESLERGQWEQARERFESAVDRTGSPDALEGLAAAAWWQQDVAAVFEARESAYRLFREGGDRIAAARVAATLAIDYLLFRGEPAVANGWLQRARRLLDGQTTSPEHGFVAMQEGLLALEFEGDMVAAGRLAAEAATVGREVGAVDIEMTGLALEGLSLVSAGAVADGMRRLDEAVAAATGGEMTDPFAIGFTCCYMMFACERVRDYDRAAQWCERIRAFCERTGLHPLLSICRAHYASTLMFHGRWGEAEAELAAVTQVMRDTHQGMLHDGLLRLAELRRRQGRLGEAADLLDEVSFHPRATLCEAAIALDLDDPALAVELARRFLRQLPDENLTERVEGLEVLARALAAEGDGAGVEEIVAELRSAAMVVDTPPLRAARSIGEGLLAVVAGRPDEAQRLFEDAVHLYRTAGMPFEAAHARLGFATACVAAGRVEQATRELRAAVDELDAIGASRDAVRARSRLRELDAEPEHEGARLGLTAREIDVLRLVARGMTNREIAEQLVVSEHTVHRHVANILTKLGVASRTAAATIAAQAGIV